MGAWGPGSLENDKACDFIGDLGTSAPDDFELVEEVLGAFLDDPADVTSMEQTLAATEFIAALRGHPSLGFLELLPMVTEEHRIVPERLHKLAVQAIETAQSNTELQELWPPDQQDAWHHELRELLSKVQLPPSTHSELRFAGHQPRPTGNPTRASESSHEDDPDPMWVRVVAALCIAAVSALVLGMAILIFS
jgi:hypothetical protein